MSDDYNEGAIREVMRVFREFIIDCETDIEGCDGAELTEIEHALTTARELRRRLMGHLTGETDVRGIASAARLPSLDRRAHPEGRNRTMWYDADERKKLEEFERLIEEVLRRGREAARLVTDGQKRPRRPKSNMELLADAIETEARRQRRKEGGR